MKLSEKESSVIGAVELKPDISLKSIRRSTGLREHTIRYALKRLEDRKVITKIPLVNLHRLGLITFNVFFSLSAHKREARQAVLKFLNDSPEVVWIGEFGGEFQYGIALVSKSAARVTSFLREVAIRFPNAFFEKELSLQSACTIFPRRYISGTSRKSGANPIRLAHDGADSETTALDELDDRLLSAMATDGSASHRQLAERLKIAASTIDLRVKKLVERKIIAGYIYAVDPGLFEMQQFKLLIYAKGINPELTKSLTAFCAAQINVPSLIECSGSWDYEIGIDVKNAELVSFFVQELYEHFGTVINTVKILTRFRDSKTRWYPG